MSALPHPLLAAEPACAATLHAAVHWRVQGPFAADEPCFERRLALLGELAQAQLAGTGAAIGFVPQATLLCSTVLTRMVSAQAPREQALLDAVQAAAGGGPRLLLSAYQCAAWGFALRFASAHTQLRRLAIVLVDVDLHRLRALIRNPAIGGAGFGVTSLLLELPQDRSARPACAGPFANSAISEFLLAMQARQRADGRLPTYIPFMHGPLAAGAERTLGADTLGPNLHAELGHCFGADPWIGIVRQAARCRAAGQVMAGSVALSGYYSFARIAIAPAAHLEMRHLSQTGLPGPAEEF